MCSGLRCHFVTTWSLFRFCFCLTILLLIWSGFYYHYWSITHSNTSFIFVSWCALTVTLSIRDGIMIWIVYWWFGFRSNDMCVLFGWWLCGILILVLIPFCLSNSCVFWMKQCKPKAVQCIVVQSIWTCLRESRVWFVVKLDVLLLLSNRVDMKFPWV